MKILLVVIALIFLCSCATIDHPCARAALAEAEKIQEKDKLLFVSGNYNSRLWARHVQLWILKENGNYEILTGEHIDELRFRATHYFNYEGYINKLKRVGFIK